MCGLASDDRSTRGGSWRQLGSCLLLILVGGIAVPSVGRTQEPDTAAPAALKPKEPLPIELGKNWIRATRDYEVWVDVKQKKVLLGGRVCLREGLLEMFACPEGTKEHESVVAVNTPARFVHAALVATGAKPGPPVQFQPQYKPAQGTPIEVIVVWKDEEGVERRVRAQEWVKRNSTGKALEYPWVFAGSGFWTDEAAGERFYYADGGELICVSNFSTAMLDLPVESSDTNDSLMFCAFTENIPPRGTRICLILTPQLDEPATKEPATKEPAAKEPNAKEPNAKEPNATEPSGKNAGEAGEKGPASKLGESTEKLERSAPKSNAG